MPLLALQNTGDSLDHEIIIGCKTFLMNAIKTGEADPGDWCAIAYASRLAGDYAKTCKICIARGDEYQADDGGWITHYLPFMSGLRLMLCFY